MSRNRLFTLLRSLEESKAQLILVGGLAAVLHGAPVQTYDVDILRQTLKERRRQSKTAGESNKSSK